MFFITTILWNGVVSLFNLTPDELPELAYVKLISFGVAVTLALQTTYFVDGRKGKVWSDTFGIDPENFKED